MPLQQILTKLLTLNLMTGSMALGDLETCAEVSRNTPGHVADIQRALNEAGFKQARIVVSSGFGPAKCKAMAIASAPIDVVGTGSYLPARWSETYATADIVAYDGEPRVKVGREFLLRERR